MRTTDHGTWIEYGWEVGDLVRLKEPERLTPLMPAKAGDWGRVVDVRDGYWVEVRLAGLCRKCDSLGSYAKVSRFDLEPWARRPEDEAAVSDRVVEALTALCWSVPGTNLGKRAGRASTTVSCLKPNRGARPVVVDDVVLPHLLPFLGDGRDGVSGPSSSGPSSWEPNAAGHRLLDDRGVRRVLGLAGGGNAFDFEWDRTGSVTVHDRGTGLRHRLEGGPASDFLAANHHEVGMLHDGRMPDVARSLVPFPRTLRAGRGFAVVDVDGETVEVRRDGRETFHVEAPLAHAVRRACARVADLAAWLDRKVAEPEAVAEAPSP